MSERREPVLIVEDDPDNRALLRMRVARRHHEVIEAGSGEEALELARARPPALIFLDIRLPGIDGWEVIQQLLGDPQLCDVPVVVVSIVDDPGDVPRPPVAGYLTKPFHTADVDRVLRELLPDRREPMARAPQPGGGP